MRLWRRTHAAETGDNVLGFRAKRKRAGVAAGIAFGRAGAAGVYLQGGGRDGLPRLRASAVLQGTEPDVLADALERWTDGVGADGAQTHVVLAPGEYQLLQIEAPPVPATEMRQAAAWRVRDLLDYPIDQAVVDTFDPPEAAQRGQPNVNVAAAHRTVIAERVEQVGQAGLALASIDIPELAQGNVSERLPDARGGHALLALEEGDGLLTVYRDGQQFLARGLDSGHAELAADEEGRVAESLLLEVQRSFDYFESALSQPPLGALYLFPPLDAVERFAPWAEDNLANVACRSVALADLVAVEDEPASADGLTLRALGAALRGLEGGH
jgi:MSHA biogenesis protein MshI